ncbi:SGNH/GDSL hydrolase family protein [Actinoplanes sp. TFC3]|uniref:SGNH/GDSL hydrolase family protein n=1 Tax=Actinoplanes sp. TFC3 TaxID=1710355 RepID=UPI000836FC52|nr:SGNH/GDSL hydrolase family protein [Actinoplanes sp. TFC3]
MGAVELNWPGVRRLGVKAVTGVLAVGVVVGLGVPKTITSASAAAPQTTPAVSVQQAFQPMRVMALGDSITRGNGSPTRSSYRMALKERLLQGGMEINYVGSQNNGTGTDINHEGHGGWSINQLEKHTTAWLDAARPDVVLLHAGTNNIARGHGPYTTARKLSELIDQIRAARPEAYIFVAQIIMSRVPREAAQDRVYNRLIPSLVAAKQDDRLVVVDQSTISGIDLHDLHHPNDFGYAKMAWNWYRAMARVFATSGYTGANPYLMTRTNRCLASKVIIDGAVHHRTECRSWVLRSSTARINGVNRRVRVWQTLREGKQTYSVRKNGKLLTRTRMVQRWTGPGNLLDV